MVGGGSSSEAPICRDNLRGNCRRGSYCKFLHQDSRNSQFSSEYNEGDSSRKSPSREGRSRSPCRKFLSGRCYRGSTCRYLHSEFHESDRPMHTSQCSQAVNVGRDSTYDYNILPVLTTGGGGSTSEEGRQLIPVCRDNLRGDCSRGSSCKFRHYDSRGSQFSIENNDGDSSRRSPNREGRSRSPCRKFLSGHCNRGSTCRYLHPECNESDRPMHSSRCNQAVNVSNVSTSRSSSPERNSNQSASKYSDDVVKQKMCVAYTKGECEKGSDCRDFHSYHEYMMATGQADQCATTAVTQELDTPNNDKMQSNECKHTDSSFESTDYPTYAFQHNQSDENIEDSPTVDIPESADIVQPDLASPRTLSDRRKLLVLDLNGLLVDIVADFPDKFKPEFTLDGEGVFKRPFCDDFLMFCFERFDVGIWSSRTKSIVTGVVDFLLKNTENRLLFCWDRSHCTETEYKTHRSKDTPLVLKELKNLWEKKEKYLPWERGLYNESNTILIDHSPYKAILNPPHTGVYPTRYSFEDVEDNILGPDGDLRLYLERLAEAENVQKFIRANLFW